MSKSKMIVRTTFIDRACHWTVVICFFLVALSGISFFFPTLQWLTETFGTPQMGRILHPFFGVLIFVALMFMFVRFIIWRPYFAEYFPMQVIRYSLLIHATSAIILIHAILIHMYMAFWVKGSIKGMIEGKVSRRWAKKHHPRWYRDVERLEAMKENREGMK
ncbi:cytochrome b/b6 domain-containing protein [Klebsiella pneumoniae]|uniref:cytochrome b/b6 domain-containing protein n=1 Tax=Klebsiella pneumoniae TaxID=573 RepID=UPI00133010D3|nr:cytochrome b/b6 domain-containing protein [Klebsiella pneumoniae]MDG0590531.1 cytochrome b/b6 domain-containing protein [Klebsiella pneumoniae]